MIGTPYDVLRFLPNKELHKFQVVLDTIERLLAKGSASPRELGEVRRKINHMLMIVWQRAIEMPFFYDGRFREFSESELAIVFHLNHPTVIKFDNFRSKIDSLPIEHAIKDEMRQVLGLMQPIIALFRRIQEITGDSKCK